MQARVLYGFTITKLTVQVRKDRSVVAGGLCAGMSH